MAIRRVPVVKKLCNARDVAVESATPTVPPATPSSALSASN